MKLTLVWCLFAKQARFMSMWVTQIKKLLLKICVFKCPASQPQLKSIVMEGWSCIRLWIWFFYVPLQKCFWIPAGLGVHPLRARQFASSRNQAHRTLNWSSAKCVTLSSALLANLIGIQVKAVKRACQSLFFQEKQGKILKKIKYLEAKNSKRHFPDFLF